MCINKFEFRDRDKTWKRSSFTLGMEKNVIYKSIWRKVHFFFLQHRPLNSMRNYCCRKERVRGYIMRIISRRCWHTELYLELWYVVLNDRVWIKQRPSTAIDCQTLEISLINSSQRAIVFGVYGRESSSSLYNRHVFSLISSLKSLLIRRIYNL